MPSMEITTEALAHWYFRLNGFLTEGYERDGNRELLQFLSHAKGSCGEVRAQLHLAKDQHYLDDTAYRNLTERSVEISKMLSGLTRYLKKSQLQGAKYRD